MAEAQAPKEWQFQIEGMHCAACVRRIETAVRAVPGVGTAEVNLATGALWLQGQDQGQALAARVTDAVAQAGFGVVDDGALRGSAASTAEHLRRDVRLAAALTLPVVLTVMAAHLIPAVHHAILNGLGQTGFYLAQFTLTTVLMIGPGRRFYTAGLPALWRGAPEMNALVALGTMAAWGFSTVVTLAPAVLPEASRVVYFEAVGVIITLILLGRWLEARAKGRTGQAIEALMRLTPPVAVVMTDGVAQEVPVAMLRRGQQVLIRPGAQVPVDGVVVQGSGHVQEAMLTGEPAPVAKAPGDFVTGGTLNTTGALTIEVTHVGADTALAGIIAMVARAQGSKLPIQAILDRITGVFVPIILGLAVLTLAGWLVFGPAPQLSHALVASVAVLIIACPCAMGLATPVSLIMGIGRATQEGVLFRNGAALEALARVDVVAFDKTGTLTEGRPEVTDFEALPGEETQALWAAMAGIETQSDHPIARAIVTEAARQGVVPSVPSEVLAVAGQGVWAAIGSVEFLLGNARLMAARGIALDAFQEVAETWSGLAKTPVFVARDQRVVAVLAVSDPIKRSASSIEDLGLRVAMITGDTQATARAVAKSLGIEEVHAEVPPDGKMAVIEALQRAGKRVAFVGDGINDAPALAAADVGIALGTGTDVAMETADVVLTSGDLSGVVRARRLSQAVMRNIRQNLVWAFGYNVALIPVAMGLLWPLTGVLLSPMLAAAAMALSSVFVVSNALRLGKIKLGGAL